MHTAEAEFETELGQRIERFTLAAKVAGLKLTPQRLEIFRVLAGSAAHPTAEGVHQLVTARLPQVSLDTVYRTLWMLTDLGVLGTLGPRQQSVRFDANLTNHHHFVCFECGVIRDFESPELDALALPTSTRQFGHTNSTRVEVHGVCVQCAAHSTTDKLTH